MCLYDVVLNYVLPSYLCGGGLQKVLGSYNETQSVGGKGVNKLDTCKRARTHTHIYTYTYKHIHIHTHTVLS
jgi:hypothetical protein